MLWRSSRGRPLTRLLLSFIPVSRPSPAAPSGPGWAHELKHDGYRLQIHVRDGRVRLYTMNGADWSKRYPLIIERRRGLRALPFLMLRWSGLTPMGWRTSGTAQPLLIDQAALPSPSIC